MGPTRLSFWLALLTLAGCGGDNLGPSPRGYEPDGFSAYGARSDAGLPPRMSSESDGSYRLSAHMDKQDPRWSDRDWRDERRSERLAEARRDRDRKRRANEREQKRAAALEAYGGY